MVPQPGGHTCPDALSSCAHAGDARLNLAHDFTLIPVSLVIILISLYDRWLEVWVDIK